MGPRRRRPPSRVVGHLHLRDVDAGHALAAEFEDQRLFVIEPAIAGDRRQLVRVSDALGAVGRP